MQSPHIPRKHNGSHSRQRLLHSCRLPKLAELAEVAAFIASDRDGYQPELRRHCRLEELTFQISDETIGVNFDWKQH